MARKPLTLPGALFIAFFTLIITSVVFAQAPKGKTAPQGPVTKPEAKTGVPPAPVYKATTVALYSSKFGRSGYIQGFALAEVLSRHSKWLKATAEESLGGTDNVKLGEGNKNASMMIVSETPYKLAREGKVPFNKPIPDIKIVCVGFRAAHFFGSLDPKIKTYQDMIGKRVGVGPKADVHGIKGTEQLKYCYENLDKVKLMYMPAPQIADALVDRIIDVGYLTASPGYPKWNKDEVLEALASAHKVYPIPLAPEQAKKAEGKAESTFFPTTIPADFLFKGQPATGASVGFIYWAAFSDLPDEVVYEVLRMFHDYQSEFVEQHMLMTALIPDQLGMGNFTSNDLHPGALKFYKDRGMKIGR